MKEGGIRFESAQSELNREREAVLDCIQEMAAQFHDGDAEGGWRALARARSIAEKVPEGVERTAMLDSIAEYEKEFGASAPLP